ncbi:MAG: hypothetical protein ABEJ70_00795 [Halobacteriaceae archaeon]
MTDRRGVSTVVDVSLCLLLVSAAAVTLVTATPPPRRPHDSGRPLAATLAASDAAVTYHVGTPNGVATRRAEGTIVELLAGAVRVRRRPGRVRGYVPAVRRVVNRTLRRAPGRAGVTAVGRTDDGRSVRVSAGRRPPPGTDADAVRITVPGHGPDARPVRVVVRTWSP